MMDQVKIRMLEDEVPAPQMATDRLILAGMVAPEGVR